MDMVRYPYSFQEKLLSFVTEMSAMNGDTSLSNDPNAILNACREIHRGIDEVESSVQKLHDKYLDVDKFTSSEELKKYKKEVGSMSLTTRGLYRNLLQRMMKIKADPASGNPRNEKQVGATERRLKGAMNQWQQSDMEYRRRLQDQGRRQYLTINPDASEAEVTQAMESSSATNMFQTAVSISIQL
jgi:syntaxin 1B/2/3